MRGTARASHHHGSSRTRRKQKQKRVAEEKKAEKEKKLNEDQLLRAKEWLRGISKDITKLKTAYNEVCEVQDIGVKQLYKLKLKGHLSELTTLRVSLGKGDVCDKKVFKSASAAVDACKADIQAWSKVRSVYVEE